MTTSHMKGQCVYVCVCEGGKCMPVCQTRQTKPLPSPPHTPLPPSTEDIHSDVCWGARSLPSLGWRVDLLPLSELLALLILCFSICCLSPSFATAVRLWGGVVTGRGRQKTRCHFAHRFVNIYWPFLSAQPQFILFDLKDLHAKFDVICFFFVTHMQTNTHRRTHSDTHQQA